MDWRDVDREWKPVPNYPEYEINRYGEVREAPTRSTGGRLPRIEIAVDDSNNVCVLFGSPGTERKAHLDNRRVFRLDRIVAAAFLVTTPQDLMSGRQLIHLDGNPENCEADNLAWEVLDA